MNKLQEKNPFAKADGTSMEGKLGEFIDWEEKQSKIRVAKMSPEEKKQYDKAMERMSKKMNS